MNFVFVSLQRISTDRESTSTSLAKELSKNHNVLYVNSPIDKKTFYLKKYDSFTKAHIELIQSGNSGLSKLSENLWVLNPLTIINSINWIPNTKVFSFFNKKNNKKFANEIQKAVDELGYDSFILINDKDIFRSYYLKELLNPALYIYLDRDYTLGMKYWQRHGKKLEPELIKKSDAVVCNSPTFTKNALKYNPNSFYIGNGCDLTLYEDENTKPAIFDQQSITRPIIGYIGALISMRLDLNLLIQVALERTDWSFILVGPDDQDFRSSVLYNLPNVFYLGKIHTSEVPSYVKAFDICINPQILNEITDGNFPLKIIEYLALGKPVVATSTTTMREVFENYTYLATNKSEYIEQIMLALNEDSRTLKHNRIEFSKQFSWEQITKNLINAITAVQ